MDVGLIKFLVVVVLIVVGWTLGRKNERDHLRDLAIREEELRNVLVFATRYPPMDGRTLDPHLVSGSAVVAADHFKMFVAGLRKFVGGRFDAYETLIDRARRQALLRMKEQALAANSRMVFNVRVETTRITVDAKGAGSTIEVFAYGTAFAPAVGTVTESTLHYNPGEPLADAKVQAGFDLTKHRGTGWALALWSVLLAWGFVELAVIQSYWYLDGAPWIAFLIIAAAAFVAGAWALDRGEVPRATAVGFSLLLCATLPPLLYMPALRVNALTDLSPVTENLYRLEADHSLTPLDSGRPVLRFPNYIEYFEAQPVGSEHSFVLRRGLLGFWQLERDALAKQFRAFYRSR